MSRYSYTPLYKGIMQIDAVIPSNPDINMYLGQYSENHRCLGKCLLSYRQSILDTAVLYYLFGTAYLHMPKSCIY